MDSKTQTIKHFLEYGFTVVAIPKDYHVDYIIHDHFGIQDGKVLYTVDDVDDRYPYTDDITKAEIFIEGNIKWDGCSNWNYVANADIMLHGCCKDDILRFGLILGECWDMMDELCPHWNP